MNTQQALDILNQLRLQTEATGRQHDIAREAYEVLKAFISSKNAAS